MKIEKKNGVSRSRGLLFAALLAVILAALFWKSFLPGYVHFSNDGPLDNKTPRGDSFPLPSPEAGMTSTTLAATPVRCLRLRAH